MSEPRGRCELTGLSLVAPRGRKVWRIAKGGHGPLNPPLRGGTLPADPSGWGSWSRWDVPHHRTVYTATKRVTAFEEALAYFRRSVVQVTSKLDALIDELTDNGWRGVADEWHERGSMLPGQLAQAWRIDRAIYELRLPEDGWLVRVETAESMSAIQRALEADLAELEVDEVDLSILTGDRRDITTLIASWIHCLVLDDGTRPLGIEYPSRRGGDPCQAVWLRELDEGKTLVSELTKVSGQEQILEADADFLHVCDLFSLRGF